MNLTHVVELQLTARGITIPHSSEKKEYVPIAQGRVIIARTQNPFQLIGNDLDKYLTGRIPANARTAGILIKEGLPTHPNRQSYEYEIYCLD